MEISVLGIALTLLLLAIPIYILFYYRVPLLHKVLVATGKMLAFLAFFGGGMLLLQRFDHPMMALFVFVLMTVASALVVGARLPKLQQRFFIPLMVGMGASSLLVTLYVVLFVFRHSDAPLATQWFVPLAGLLVGRMIETNGKALDTYYAGLRHHGALFRFLRGNGASHAEAVAYLTRRALTRVALPEVSRMAYMFLGSTPLVFWVMLINGYSLLTAVGMQLVVVVGALTASVLSIVITLLVARRYLFDEYDKLKK